VTLFRRHFDAVPESVGASRRFLAEVAPAACNAELLAAVTLAISELATNAVVHGTDIGFDVVITSNGQLRLEVEDGSTRVPVVRPHSAIESGGRGLHVLDAVCDRWGVHVTDGRKCVWCERDLSGPRPATSEGV
jgi:anti-sigma regulatory factor (Ser/Thr protein kinase)